MIILKDYPDYAINENGEVYSLYYINRFGKYLRKAPFKLKSKAGNNGYCAVTVGSQKNNAHKRISVHRLVANTFIKNPKNKPDVNHKNGVKTDNRVENLEWVTKSENETHAHHTGLKNFIRENNPACKITAQIAKKITKEYSVGSVSQRFLAKKFNISQALVNNIINGNAWA